MDEYIRNSIETRKQSIYDYFSVPKEMESTVSQVFADMEALGESCKDVAEFETKIAQSPVNQRYMALFSGLKPSAGAVKDAMKDSIKMKGKKQVAKEVAETVAMEVEQAVVQPLRHEAYEQRREFLRKNVPGYAKAQDTANTISVGKRLAAFVNRKEIRAQAEADAAELTANMEQQMAADQAAAEAEIARLTEEANKAAKAAWENAGATPTQQGAVDKPDEDDEA